MNLARLTIIVKHHHYTWHRERGIQGVQGQHLHETEGHESHDVKI